MKQTLIDQTNRYAFYHLLSLQDSEATIETKDLQTYFVHKGSMQLSFSDNGQIMSHELAAGQGFNAPPNTGFTLKVQEGFVGFMASSSIPSGRSIVEIVDNGDSQEERQIEKIELILEPKKVSKPWGHELWVLWTKDFHVLKQIAMDAGNRSSLQYHHDKLETNYLVEGEADVIDGVPTDTSISVQDQVQWAETFDWQAHCETKHKGDHWTSVPGIVHRVTATKDYVAYEVSTPELDDVIRLHDDKGRHSGRVDSEHVTV